MTLAAIGVGMWVLVHVFVTLPIENTSEVAAGWTFGLAAASFVVAAVVPLAVGVVHVWLAPARRRELA